MTDDVKARLFGLGLIIVAVAFGWFFVLAPLYSGQAGGPQSGYGIKVFVFVPFCIVYGLAFLILGAGMRYRNAAGTNFTVLGWVVLIIAAIASGAGFFWFKQQIGG